VAIKDALRPGTVLSGKIRIERVVGQGSMGVVLEATDLPLQRRVAVKILAPARAHDEEARKRFLREARAAVRLSSQHVTRVIDVGELDDGTPYLVMEYLVGSTLEQVLQRDGPPPIDVAVDWVLQALDGVAEAHRAGFVHRDLKPENLFLAERPGAPPIVKVLDFGTVKDLVTKATKLTRTGSTMGSPAYMAPEQVRAEEIDQRVDVWAMGVTLYELVTGKLPFIGESVPQTLAAILRDPPVPLRLHRPDAPPELQAVIERTLCKDREGRYRSATEMLGELSIVRARLEQSSPDMAKTLQMGRTLPLSRPDPSADTTDVHRMFEADASRIRPRVIVSAPEKPPVTRRSSHSPLFWPIVIAVAVALALGASFGFLLSSKISARHPPPVASTTATPATTEPAPVASVAPAETPAAAVAPSTAPSTTTATAPPTRPPTPAGRATKPKR
jgi:serine/threonine-protein kinase